MFLNNREDIKKSITKCEHYLKSNAQIQYIESCEDSIAFKSDDMTHIKVVTDALKEALYMIDILNKSDFDKEKSSMMYYNDMKEYRDKSKMQSEMISLMLDWIVDHSDCPLENEDTDVYCEIRCNDDKGLYKDCWEQFFINKLKDK